MRLPGARSAPSNRPLHIKLDPDLGARLEQRAAADGRSLKVCVERALRVWLALAPVDEIVAIQRAEDERT